VLQKLSLTAMGGVFIFAGMMSKLIMGQINPPTNRSELLGQGLAQLMFFVAGMVMIGIGLVKGRKA